MANFLTKSLQWHAPIYYNSKTKLFLWMFPFIFSIVLLFIYNNEVIDYLDAEKNISPVYFNYITLYIIILVVYYSLLGIAYKRKDSKGSFGQLFFRHKYSAIYTLKDDKIIIKFNKSEIIYPLKDIKFFANVAPESVRYYGDEQFTPLYLIKSRILYYKYIPVLVPREKFDIIFDEFSKVIKFYNKNEIGAKVTPLYIKIILILAFAIFFIVSFLSAL